MSDKTQKASSPDLEHTAGGVTTRDGMDQGVPMIAGQPDEPIGPEDAMGPGPKRGDYSERLQTGPAMRTEVIPESERKAVRDEKTGVVLDEGPKYRSVPASPDLTQADVPGKGGVPTDPNLRPG